MCSPNAHSKGVTPSPHALPSPMQMLYDWNAKSCMVPLSQDLPCTVLLPTATYLHGTAAIDTYNRSLAAFDSQDSADSAVIPMCC
jgi:hypothetical protein